MLEVPNDDATFASWGSRTIADALDHGLKVALVLPGDDQSLPVIDQGSLDQFFAAVTSLSRDPERAPAMYRKWDRVAEWARGHDPGRGANGLLKLQGDAPEDPRVRLLMRRAFGDLSSVSLELLSAVSYTHLTLPTIYSV